MKWSQIPLLIVLLLCQGQATQAQNNSVEESSLLWKLEGHGIQPSYLFGTLHMLPQEQFSLGEKVADAFRQSQQIVLELDMDQPGLQMDIIKNMPMKEGKTLDQLMSPQDYEKLDTRLQELLGMGVQMFNNWKPFGITSMLYLQYAGGIPASFEGTFVQMAKEQQKEVLGLETVEAQMAVFDAISYQEQVKDIIEMLNDEGGSQAMFSEMVDLYLQEDLEGLGEFIDQYLDTQEEREYLLYRRNHLWVPRIGEMAASQSSFIAVGAAHLCGDQGLISLLRKAGYQVSPLF